MGQNLSRKILATHLLSENMNIGEEIAIRIDQTLTHDVTGTQAYLAFETMNIPRVKTELSVSYVDHNLLYADNKTLMTTFICSLLLKSTVFTYRVQVMAFAIQCILSVLVNQEKSY